MNVTACWESWCADVTVSYALLIVFAAATSIWCLTPRTHEPIDLEPPPKPRVPKPQPKSDTPVFFGPLKRKPGRPKGSGTKKQIAAPVVPVVEPASTEVVESVVTQ